MKKNITVLLFISMLTVFLSGCGDDSNTNAAPVEDSDSSSGENTPQANDTDSETNPSTNNDTENIASVFIHPGTLVSQTELDYVKTKIAANEEPWTSQFEQIQIYTNREPSPFVNINSEDDSEANASKRDARGAYASALYWAYTGDDTYAEKAIAILNSWTIFEGFTAGTDQDKLQAAWIGSLFGPAADIMLGYSGWAPEDIAAVQDMFKRAFYPQLNTASSWNGNVDLTQIDALMSIAVFNDDKDEFDMGLERLAARMPNYFYLATDGERTDTGTWSNPTSWIDGLTQETCRDNGHHAQYALSAALAAAETAWHQGEDAYALYQDRFVSAMELLATQIVSGSMQGTCEDDVTNPDLYNTFEIGYNHYHNRMGIELPNTLTALTEKIRPYGQSDWNIFYETLTHANLEE